MAYTPNPSDATNPLDTIDASTAAAEFRALKAYLQTLAGFFPSWNPADSSASILLSGNNLISTKNNVDLAYHATRANRAIGGGKIYWEITINSAGSPKPIFGIGTINAALENFVGSDAFSYGYGGDLGNKFINGVSSAFGAAPAQGDVIGFALDLTIPQLQIFKNNVSQGTIAIAAGKSWFAMASFQVNGEQSTVNFGTSLFAFAPPAGFSSYGSSVVAVPDIFSKQYFPTF